MSAREVGPVVGGHPLPARLAEQDDPGIVAWRAGLAELVPAVLDDWSLAVEPPFEPGGSCSWVAPVRGADGAELVLKVGSAHDEARDEAAGMAAWQGHGAARVLRAEARDDSSLLLMERVRPGIELSQAAPWPVRDEVVATLARRLREVPDVRIGQPFRPLAEMCAWWADEAQARADAARDTGENVLPAELVDRGLALFRELPTSWDGEPALLATDLHHHNVLARDAGGERSWVLIDPKPYVGDPHYDVLQHMLNDGERLAAEPSAFAERMARLAGLDPERTRAWLLARCVQEAGTIPHTAEAALRLDAEVPPRS